MKILAILKQLMMALIQKHRKFLRCFLLLIVILNLSLVVLYTAGCTAEEKYKVLSFFFDGVPPPGSQDKKALGKEEDILGKTGAVRSGSEHKPYGDNTCDACHKPGAITELRGERDDLCWSCHKDLLQDTAKLHGPAVSGQCLACHDAHRSERDYLLKFDSRELCLFCHETGIRHGKEDQFINCTFCHSPHGSAEAFYLRAEEEVENADAPLVSDEGDTSIDNLKQVDE